LLHLWVPDTEKTREQLMAELDVVRTTPDVYFIARAQVMEMQRESVRVRAENEQHQIKQESMRRQMVTYADTNDNLEFQHKRMQHQIESMQQESREQLDQNVSLRAHMLEQQEKFANARTIISDLREGKEILEGIISRLQEEKESLEQSVANSESPRMEEHLRELQATLLKEQEERAGDREAHEAVREGLERNLANSEQKFVEKEQELMVQEVLNQKISELESSVGLLREEKESMTVEASLAAVEREGMKEKLGKARQREELTQDKMLRLEEPSEVLIRARKEIITLQREGRVKEIQLERHVLEHNHFTRIVDEMRQRLQDKKRRGFQAQADDLEPKDGEATITAGTEGGGHRRRRSSVVAIITAAVRPSYTATQSTHKFALSQRQLSRTAPDNIPISTEGGMEMCAVIYTARHTALDRIYRHPLCRMRLRMRRSSCCLWSASRWRNREWR
jgi:hypothetical protein